MKGSPMLETLNSLGVVSSFNRPRVSNHNAYADSIFKTCKYSPDYPDKGFSTKDEARDWVLKFSHWNNFNHKHSGIKYVTLIKDIRGWRTKYSRKEMKIISVLASETLGVGVVIFTIGIYHKKCT